MPNHIILALSLLTTGAFASEWRPPERLLKAIRLVESCDGLYTYGDEGRSLGDFQLSEGAWMDVTSWRKTHDLRTYEYSRKALNRQVNQAYAADYLTLIHNELERVYRRPPSAGEIYAAYNMGLGRFASCHYQLRRINRVTAKKCRAIHTYMETAPPVRLAMVQRPLALP